MSAYYATRIEDIDGDLIEIAGNSDDELVTVSIYLDEEMSEEYDTDAFYSEFTPEDARVLAAALLLAAAQAEVGNVLTGLGL